jgi:predicted ester cyclase
MSAEENIAIARRWLTAGAMGALELADQTFAADFRTNGRLAGTDGPKRNVRNRLNGFPDFRVQIEDQFAAGDKVVPRLRWRGTHLGDYSGLAATGRSVDAMALTIFRFQGGLVTENWTVIDQFSLFQQLAALPPELKAAQIAEPAT